MLHMNAPEHSVQRLVVGCGRGQTPAVSSQLAKRTAGECEYRIANFSSQPSHAHGRGFLIDLAHASLRRPKTAGGCCRQALSTTTSSATAVARPPGLAHELRGRQRAAGSGKLPKAEVQYAAWRLDLADEEEAQTGGSPGIFRPDGFGSRACQATRLVTAYWHRRR